jgi:negative regulator of flagellin synthesis FlgM
MSQKIEGTPPPAVRSTGPVGGRIAPAGGDRSNPVEAPQAGDSLRLTGEATSLQALQRELSAAPAIDQARVAEVRQALESGSYRIDPAKIAERMMDLDKQLGG